MWLCGQTQLGSTDGCILRKLNCCTVCFVIPQFSMGDVIAEGLAVIHGIPSLLLRSLAHKPVLQNKLWEEQKQCEEVEIVFWGHG